jgi:hypothetical protein
MSASAVAELLAELFRQRDWQPILASVAVSHLQTGVMMGWIA